MGKKSEDAEKLEKFLKVNNNNIKDNKDDFERLIKYISYCDNEKESHKYFNFFEVLNMGENTSSQLLAFLLDVNFLLTKITDKNERQEKMIHYYFCLEFFKLIKEKERKDIEILEKIINNESDENKIKELIEKKKLVEERAVISKIEKLGKFVWGIEAEPNVKLNPKQKNYIDIFLKTIDNNFTCIIENKKLADICYTDNSQIERYHEDLENKYPKSNRKYILICGDYNYTNQNLQEHTSKRGKDKEQVQNTTISNLLEKNLYTVIDHRDVIMVLWKVLSKIYPDAFNEYKILKPSSSNKMLEMISNLCKKEFINKNKSYDAIQEMLRNKEIKNVIEKCNKNNEFLRYDNHILQILKQINKRISGNLKIKFYDSDLNIKFKESLEDRLEVFCRYVEYWELHRSIGSGKDNLPGETKIVDGKCIYQVCKDIQDNYSNKDIYDKFPKRVRSIITEYTGVE